MNNRHGFRGRWRNRVLQFGLLTSVRQACSALIRPVRRVEAFLFLAIPDHSPTSDSVQSCSALNVEDLEVGKRHGSLSDAQRENFLRFLQTGCFGFKAEIDGAPAGFAFVQKEGALVFGTTQMQIPEGFMLLKNLLVLPEFRGRSLGKHLNQRRINAIPKGVVPLVLVVVENQFAIRNLEMFGFKQMLIAKKITWIRKWSKTKVDLIDKSDCGLAILDSLRAIDKRTLEAQ